MSHFVIPPSARPTAVSLVVLGAMAIGVSADPVRGLVRLAHVHRGRSGRSQRTAPGLPTRAPPPKPAGLDHGRRRVRAAGGTGLGLAFAHGVIIDHGGEIHVESKPGKGTRIRIQLPVVQA